MTAEYKNYLFVKVQPDATDFVILKVQGSSKTYILRYSTQDAEIQDYLHGEGWQIIGKGDGIDWEGIVESHEFANKDNWARTDLWYKDYETKEYKWLATPTESGHSLLRSLDMEPGTTLVFKKNVK